LAPANLIGGPARWRVIVVLAGVLALDGADRGVVSAIAPQLIRALRISDTELGLLVSAPLLVAAVATLPIGVLADRTNRTRLLVAGALLWSLVMVACGASASYLMLLLCRLALGGVLAAAVPVVASLTGDLFPGGERARMYGFILAGELVGTGIGFLLSGTVAGAISWRWGFWILVLPSAVLAYVVRRWLAEPARGGQSHLQPGAEHIPNTAEAPYEEPMDAASRGPTPATGQLHTQPIDGALRAAVERSPAEADRERMLDRDPATLGWMQALRFVLSLRTNVLLITASGLGYFFLAGLRTFAVVYLVGRYGVTQALASVLFAFIGVGGVIGVVVGGRVADARLRRGDVSARVVVAASAAAAAVLFLLIALPIGLLPAALLMTFLAAAAVGAVNPPLDAARLDVMHSRLWGRAESIRTALRTVLEATAPVLFGFVSGLFGAGGGAFGRATGAISQRRGTALEYTFMVMIVAVGAAALLLYKARTTYPSDVATAIASEEHTRRRVLARDRSCAPAGDSGRVRHGEAAITEASS
jgi:predicted MFS family arabinose efflux permease